MGADGRPSSHLVRAALHVVSIVDQGGSHINDLQQSYSHRATGGVYAFADLICAESMLLDCGLLTKQDDYLRATPILTDTVGGEAEALIALICLHAIDRLASVQALTVEHALRSFSGELDSLVEDEQRREEILLAFSRRFDDAS